MDPLVLPAGLGLLALVGAAVGAAAWKRGRASGSRRTESADRRAGVPADRTSSAPEPPTAESVPAHRVAAKSVIEQAQASAAAVAPPAESVRPMAATTSATGPASQFDGPAWAPTEPMTGMSAEPQFADTMPAEMQFAPTSFDVTNFADTMPAPLSFGVTNFADTQLTEMAVEERPSPKQAKRRRTD